MGGGGKGRGRGKGRRLSGGDLFSILSLYGICNIC